MSVNESDARSRRGLGSGWLAALACRNFFDAPQQKRDALGVQWLPMTVEIPTVFLRRLIEIGESLDFSGLRQLFAEFHPDDVGHVMRQSPQFWYSIADSLSDTELEALIRAITIAERDFSSFGGGSVSGVIWTFRRLEQRKGCRLDALADWILAHTANGWAPFGSSNGGARSLVELNAYHHHVAERRAAHQKAEKKRHTTAAERKAAKATQDMFSAIRRKDTKAVQALLLRGARLDIPGATGMTALLYAQAHGDAPILELLQSNSNGLQPNVGMDNDSHVLWAALGELSDHFSRLGGAARYFGMSESDIPLYVACTLAQRNAPSTDLGRFIDQRFLEAATPILERVNRQIAAVNGDGERVFILLRTFCSYADSKLKADGKSLRWREFLDWAQRDA